MTGTFLPERTRDHGLTQGVIAHLELLAGVPPAQTALLARHAWVLRVPRAEFVQRRQERMPGLFALAYGSIKLALRSAEGAERVVRLISARQVFGEASALLGRGAEYDAIALAESKLVVLPTAAVLELAERDSRFARNLMFALAHGKLELVAELESVTVRRGAQRLAAYLESLAGPGNGPGPTRVQLPVAKTMVASRLGIKKETLSRLLRQFVAQGVIEVARREIAILDRARLAALLQER
jgi:CRP/FNR family transcriptional regulator